LEKGFWRLVSSQAQPQPYAPSEMVESLYDQLINKAQSRMSEADQMQLRSAFEFAASYHQSQKRRSGEPYITHPLHVAILLAEMEMDPVCILTGLLHDTVEDTGATIEEIRKRFGDMVSRCVDGVTKLGKVDLHSKEERQAESVRKMLLAMVSDIRVIIVKLADRIHNMRTLDSMSDEKKMRIAEETLEIYAPIANRLGMGKVRNELEDLGLRHLDPDAYREIISAIENRRQANEQLLASMRQEVLHHLKHESIPARVDARLKRPYSVYQKLKRQRIGIDQVYDLMGIRVITDSVKNCYAALGIIHNEWHPIPGRIKDFIAIPRPNLYQSLHTSVIGPGGSTFEVQIRTEEMHRLAEEGIAAHWKYKEGKTEPQADDQRIQWLRQLVEWQKDMRDSGEFMSTLKVDLYPGEVYAFTPKGRVIILPRGASPIDFAYAIHSDVGHTCIGAKVNGRQARLSSQIRNGDVVEIQTQNGHQPSKDWLAIVKTSRARNRIKHVINLNERERAIDIGEKLLEKEARRLSLPLARLSRESWDRVNSDYGIAKREDLHAALGYGKFSPREVLRKLFPEDSGAAAPVPILESVVAANPLARLDARAEDLVLRVRGMSDDIMITRAKCCNPIRGESIVGYVTRGKGVMVHSVTCPNVQNLLYDAERKIEVEWARPDERKSEAFTIGIMIYTDDRPGMLAQFTQILYQEESNIRSLEARSDDGSDRGAVVDIRIEVRDKKQLEKVISSIRRVPGVRDVERIQ
jgi:GTP diphosphokinase / guanosine-3',5'-bis(diphosphate) 3'-diphosphatase